MPKTTPSSSNEDPRTQAIVAELEMRAHANIDAMNERDFSPTSALYYLKIEGWRATAAHGMGTKEMGLEEYMETLRQLTKNHPQFKATLRDKTTTVNAKQDCAEMYMNVEIEGMPPGIVRQTVAIVVYRLVGGVWMACSHNALPGTDGAHSM